MLECSTMRSQSKPGEGFSLHLWDVITDIPATGESLIYDDGAGYLLCNCEIPQYTCLDLPCSLCKAPGGALWQLCK